MGPKDLVNVYKVVIRSTVKYCSVVYHSHIPQYMPQQLESVQRRAMKIIFGTGVDYGELLSSGVIETLESRRIAACLRKAASDPFFVNKWFPESKIARDTRDFMRRQYQEKFCKTERGRVNPIQHMIRLLNNQTL